MAHNIDMTTGKAAVFVTGEPAWHKLGKVVESARTSAEAIILAGLDWRVEKQGMQYRNPVTGKWESVPDKFAIVRQDTGAALGVVGNFYKPFQNAEGFDFMDAIVGENLAMFETAGALDGGKRVWMMARIPTELRVNQSDDVLHPYVLLTNSHDGTGALRMIPTSVRVVCQNTLNMALGRAGNAGLYIPHFQNLTEKVEKARENLGIITRRVESFQEEINHLASVKVTDGQAKAYFKTVFKMQQKPNTDGASLLDSIIGTTEQKADLMADLLAGSKEQGKRKQESDRKLLEQLMDNFHGETNTLPGVKDTAWAAYNSVSYYTDHQSRVMGKTSEEKDNSRLNSIWFGRGDEVKQVAYAEALNLAKV